MTQRVKNLLEEWSALIALIALVTSPVSGYVAFRVSVEAQQERIGHAVGALTTDVRELRDERVDLAATLARIEERALAVEKKIDRIESKLDQGGK